MTLPEDIHACAALVEKGDPDRFAATMAAPVAAREKLFPIYALNLEAARAPWAATEPLIAQMRLQWWADVLTEVIEGREVRRHEVATPLARVLDAEGAQVLIASIEARRRDADRDDPADIPTLETYLRDTGGALMWASARALGASDAGRARAYAVGTAQALANYLLAVPALRSYGRNPLPDLSSKAFEDLILSHLRPLKRREGDLAHSPDRAQRIAELAAWRTRGVLRRALRQPDAVTEGRLEGRALATKAALIWQALRS